MKKKIGISYTETNFRYYWNWFNNEELQDIELIELSFLKNNDDDIYKCDGFILTGGVDVDPSFYQGSREYNNKPDAFEPARDRFEEKIYKYSQQNKKPLLGICRGLQMVNVLEGGTLIQDLNGELNLKHYGPEESDGQHNIRIEEGSLLYNIAHRNFGNVNSAHHQAIEPDFIGDYLMANAYDDGQQKLIEGIEFKDKTDKAFMLCVQWHPERMEDQKSILSGGIKKSFLDAVRNTI